VKCERCNDAPPHVCAIDLPSNDGGLMFGDQVLGMLLCAPCLFITSVDGPWDVVEVLDVAA